MKKNNKIYTKNSKKNDSIFDSSRTGDIVITAEPGYDLRRWEFPEHKASHGSDCDDHYKVPIFSRKRIKGAKIKITYN